MSTLTRSAKPAKSWTANDLLAFNIQVISEDLQTFFGVASLPASDVLPMIWNRIDYSPAPGHRDPPAARFFARLNGVAERFDEVSAVKDFTLSLLDTFGYDGINAFVCSGTKIPFITCGQNVSAKPDIVIINPEEAGR